VNLELELALRFLRRRTGVLLRGTALAALVGVALAVAALVITLALMHGYSSAIATALQRGNAHMVGFALGSLQPAEASELSMRMTAVDGVRRATPVTYLTGRPVRDGLAAVLGERLSQQVGLASGDSATVRLPPEGGSWILPALRLEVVGTFSLAFAEFDERWITVPLAETLEAVPEIGIAGIEIELVNPTAVDDVRQQLKDLDPRLLFTDWREMNSSLFAAHRWLTLSLFVVLSLVVAVASFQVSSALVVLAIDKQRSSGMLQALGATPARIRRVLIYSGMLLGGTGVLGGLAFGCTVSWIMTVTRAVRFPPGLARVYMVDSIPLIPTVIHITAIAGICLLIVLLSSIWPAWKTSLQDPVTSLRAA
jgi:ABC-type lipoprotein release transport system permease subunit